MFLFTSFRQSSRVLSWKVSFPSFAAEEYDRPTKVANEDTTFRQPLDSLFVIGNFASSTRTVTAATLGPITRAEYAF